MPLTTKQRETVLQALQDGYSLRKACEQADISTKTHVLNLVESDPSFADQYARARLRGYESRADRLHDDVWNMQIPADHKRVICDVQRWELSKVLPKIYGDRLDLHHTGQAADALSVEELRAIIARKEDPQGEN